MARPSVVSLVLLAACSGTIAVPEATPERGAALPADDGMARDRVLVGFDGAAPARFTDGIELIALQTWPELGLGLYAVPPGEARAVILALRETGRYRSVDGDILVTATGSGVIYGPASKMVNDEYRPYQWNFDLIAAEDAWETSRGDGVVVAVLDTGVTSGPLDGLHDLLPGYDFVNGDSDPSDDNGHGTHVAGTIAQNTDNGVGAAGVAPGASILPVKVLSATGSGWTSGIVSGVAYAVANGADVINLSLGASSYTTALADSMQAARDAGVIVVASSGNDGGDAVSYPAALPGVLAVGATGARDGQTWYSAGGPELDLVAPGGDQAVDADGSGVVDVIWQETIYLGVWNIWGYQGTSMAAPHVSGCVALLLAAGATPDEAEEALLATAYDLGDDGHDIAYGHGLVQPADALEYLDDLPGGAP